ncbi:MAG: hypothetical protein GF365_02330 [Candidatus Buchananbacteria bacterium]|nr:hypothetical protein [Candidatus Buchananbacteria bacterium]
MPGELPLLDFAEGKKKQIKPLPPKKESKPDLEINKNQESKETAQVKNLADRVARQMKQGESFLSACEKVFNTENFSKAKRKKLRSQIGELLGRRGGDKTKKIKARKKTQTVPKGKTFSPAQTEKMIKDSKELQTEEEERAGQTYQESDFE